MSFYVLARLCSMRSMPRPRIARPSPRSGSCRGAAYAIFRAILASEVAGLRFPSPVGLAAGFDKDAEVPDAMLGLGFGFVEIGRSPPGRRTAIRGRGCSGWPRTKR